MDSALAKLIFHATPSIIGFWSCRLGLHPVKHSDRSGTVTYRFVRLPRGGDSCG